MANHFSMSSVNKIVSVLFTVVILSLWPITFLSQIKWQKPVSIFHLEYESVQAIIRKTYLYPNVFLARMSQNKPLIIIAKFEHNLTALLDPNNYFFGYHPRETIDLPGSVKFPFYSLPFFLFGFFYLPKTKHGKSFIFFLVCLVFLLSLLNNFFAYDFVLYFPLAFIFLLGLRYSPRPFKKIKVPYLLICLPFATLEFARQLLMIFQK